MITLTYIAEKDIDKDRVVFLRLFECRNHPSNFTVSTAQSLMVTLSQKVQSWLDEQEYFPQLFQVKYSERPELARDDRNASSYALYFLNVSEATHFRLWYA